MDANGAVVKIEGAIMSHAVTVGDIFWPVVIITGLCGMGAFFLFLVWLFNPFRSGH
jgi:hypothetical protein